MHRLRPLAALCAATAAAAAAAAPARCAPPPPPAAAVPASSPPTPAASLRACAHEALGTGLIVLLGCGSVCSAKYLASGLSLGGASLTWGAAVALAVFATRDASGAHLNPAVTAALAVHRPEAVPPAMAGAYMAAQTLGAAGAAALNYAVFSRAICAHEAAVGLPRGAPGSAAAYAGAFALLPGPLRSAPSALAAEALATSALVYLVFALTDLQSSTPPAAAPALIGAAVTALVSVFGPVCGAGMNPARDLGPRLVVLAAGWRGEGLRGLPIYTLGPLAGAIAGGGLYDALQGMGGGSGGQ
jgi:glycerol uptake facilitator protein